MYRTMTGCYIAAAFFVLNLASAGAQSLTLEVNLVNLKTSISNNSALAVSADGLQITSAVGILDPVHWQSLADAAASDPAALSAALGSGALSFVELPSSNSNHLSELDLTSMATWPPGTRWSIGFPFGTSVSEFQTRPFDAVFQYTSSAGGVVTGPIHLTPEPGTLALAVTAAVGLLFAGGTYRRRVW